MKKKQKIGVFIIIVLVIILIALFIYFQRSLKVDQERLQNYFQNKESVAAVSDIIADQAKKTEEIQRTLDDTSCTFDNPCVVQNPYEISPLTALIIFQTNDEVEVELFINEKKVTTMERSKLHSIPVYGLQAGIINKVTLQYDGHTKDVMIDTKNVDINNLNVEVVNEKADITSDLYFLSSPMSVGAAAYDGQGRPVWYLTEPYSMDIEFLNNGHMYLSNGISSGITESYDGFYEIDYFGKIHKNYSLAHGYHHELVALRDGSIIVAGGSPDTTSPYSASYVYQIDGNSGSIIRSLDVYEVLANIDSSFANQLEDNDVFVNSIYYNEDSKEMILSLREINTIINLDFETKQVHWIFGDPSIYPSSFDSYLLKMTDGSRYPKGSHTAFITSEGYLGLYNNDFDSMDTSDPYMTHYLDNYSSAVLYQIDGKNVKTHWEYDANKEYFTYALGSFNYYEDQSKLVNYGWTYRPNAFVSTNTLFDVAGYTYARIIELDKNDREVFHATYDYGVYRSYKHRLYEETTANYMDYNYSLINNNPVSSLEKVRSSKIFDLLDEAEISPYDITLTTTTVNINSIFDPSEVVDIYFVSENQNTYLLHYKKVNEVAPGVINLRLQGNYAVYIKVNDQIYDTNKILSFN